MGIISEANEVRRIETRAITPFLDSLGGERSYEIADLIAEDSIAALALPEDSPYVQEFHKLGMAVTQNAAEIGYVQRGSDIHKSNATPTLAATLLVSFGLDELATGRYLGIGLDRWQRYDYAERSSLEAIVSHSAWVQHDFPDQPSSQALDFLDSSGVISLGVMRALRGVAARGYNWGMNGDLVEFDYEDPRIALRGGYARTMKETSATRTLQQAHELREQEKTIFRVLTEMAIAS